MRVVVGVNHDSYRSVLDLIASLAIPSTELALVHVVESPLEDLPRIEFDPVREWVRQLEDDGRRALEEARKSLQGTGFQITTEILHGDTPRVLIEKGKECGADVIAIGSTRKGHWGALFYGSVTKAVAAGAERSVLIGKQSIKSKEGLRVVIATDHSDYFNRCFEKFLGWNVQGIRSAVALTSVSARNGKHASHFKNALDALRQSAEEKNEFLCRRLQERGIETHSLVSSASPQDAISQAMREERADLLILGAQGHGFWDRVRLGSVSYYEVIATDHNVLVLRV